LDAVGGATGTHFDAWSDWHDATRKVLDRPLIKMGDEVGIGAGRTEWTYFRWAGQRVSRRIASERRDAGARHLREKSASSRCH
jgi:hypothetical protein